MSAAPRHTGTSDWQRVCTCAQLVPGSGVAALVAGRQVAIFYLPDEVPPVYAIDNHDPFSGANVLARGIVGDQDGELVVASPIYKQHFSLTDGRCLDDTSVRVGVWPVRVDGADVLIRAPNPER